MIQKKKTAKKKTQEIKPDMQEEAQEAAEIAGVIEEPAPEIPPEPQPEKPKEVEMEEHELLRHFKEVTKRSYKEIREHMGRYDKKELWERNKQDIFNEISAEANMGRNQASIFGVIVPMGNSAICLRTHESYKPIIAKLNELGFVANERSHPAQGLYISVTW